MSSRLLAMSGRDHIGLRRHLLPGDGREAAAILLCNRGPYGDDLYLHSILSVPHGLCARTPERITWPGSYLAEAQSTAEEDDRALFLIHSHPGGCFAFSETDDDSDAETVGAIVAGWCGSAPPTVGSAIMVPGGAIRARTYDLPGACRDVGLVRVVGDEILHWRPADRTPAALPMAFGAEMTRELGRRRACVIGVSGTGSVVAEQLARLGFGELVLVDFDAVEARNLNRILNSTLQDVECRRAKVRVLADAIGRYRPDTKVVQIEGSILSREAVIAASRCDVIFSCVDSSEGRQVADLLAQAFLLPLVDMGVSIPTRRLPEGGTAVAEVLGRIDYVQPGRSTLASREVFTAASLRAEYLRRVSPDAYAGELADGYIKGVPEEAPAVIALNMKAASTAVVEYIARSFPFRHRANQEFARTLFRLAEGEEEAFPESEFQVDPDAVPGRAGTEPLLGIPALGRAGP